MMNDERWNALQRGERLASRMRLDPCAFSDVILSVFESCSQTHDPSRGAFMTYYTTCLKRELIRARKRNDVSYEDELHRKEKAFGHSPLEDLITLEGKGSHDIASALKTLNLDEYELLVDKYIRGLSLYEIGVKHGIIKQSVWARLQRVLKKLRDEIR